MSKIRCPGQDTRYWKPGDIFSLSCNNCGKMVEFFKDDVNRKCPHCANRIQNPKISMGCAQWCDHAKECLGYDPAKVLGENKERHAIDGSLSEKIISEIKTKYGENASIYNDAKATLKNAFEMLNGETADPRIVIPASLLIGVVAKGPGKPGAGNKAGFSAARDILNECGLDNQTIDDICELIESILNEEEIDTPEYTIVEECYSQNNETLIN